MAQPALGSSKVRRICVLHHHLHSPLAHGPERGIPWLSPHEDDREGRLDLHHGESAMAEGTQLIRGLEGVVAAETRLCDLDGTNGRLAYCGYDIEDLARRASFEEVCHLLWHGDLPNAAQLDKTTLALIAAREIPADLVQTFRLMPKA